ncbi:hypothetical protein [Rhodanobacter terrae]|uniref:Uncharacterized protein n=1 Tax=Rhodanobacter terrae TaxID=418647 RepID=A0ABW0T226_9GAMM
MRNLSAVEIDLVSGAVNREEVLAGVGVLGGTLLAIAALPEVLVGGAVYVAFGGAFMGGAAGGGLIGDGLFGHAPSAE